MTVAGGIHELVGRLGFERIALVVHYHDGAVAYAYAAAHRGEVERLAFLKLMLMGAGGELGLDHSRGEGLWHLSFHALGGEACFGELPLECMRLVADDVRGASIPRCGHVVPEERPHALLEHLLPFLASRSAT